MSADKKKQSNQEVLAPVNSKGHRHGGSRGGGRPKGQVSMQKLIMAEAAQEHALDALETLANICKDARAPAAARVSAATAILDRAFGKPAQAVNLGENPENPLGAMIRFYLPDNNREQDE